MYPDWAWIIVAGVVFLWLGVLSFLLWKENGFLKALFPKTQARDIRKTLTEVTGSIEGFEERVKKLEGNLKGLKLENLKNIKKVKLLRYNPYHDTGGDQSFSLALLSDIGDGVVLTSLHTRAGTRVYSKPVKRGGGESYVLSEEEKAAVDEAMKS